MPAPVVQPAAAVARAAAAHPLNAAVDVGRLVRVAREVGLQGRLSEEGGRAGVEAGHEGRVEGRELFGDLVGADDCVGSADCRILALVGRDEGGGRTGVGLAGGAMQAGAGAPLLVFAVAVLLAQLVALAGLGPRLRVEDDDLVLWGGLRVSTKTGATGGWGWAAACLEIRDEAKAPDEGFDAFVRVRGLELRARESRGDGDQENFVLELL